MNPSVPYNDESVFNLNAYWKELYGDFVEEDPHKMLDSSGNPVYVGVLVDADHGVNIITRRSHSVILLFVNNSLIKYFSKRKNTFKSSTFGSELVALRIVRDMILDIRNKLKMFGVPLAGPTIVCCDNNGVVKNTSISISTLSKKHNAINYHCVREADAAVILRVRK